MNRRGFLAKCIGAAVAMAVLPLEPLLPKSVKRAAESWLYHLEVGGMPVACLISMTELDEKSAKVELEFLGGGLPWITREEWPQSWDSKWNQE